MDLSAVVATCKPDSTSKGRFLQGILDEVKKAGAVVEGPSQYIAFKDDYPIAEHVTLIANAARAIYPALPLREGMRRLGWLSFATIRDSLIGRVVFGVLGTDIQAITKLVSKAYEISGKGGQAELIDLYPDASRIRLRGFVLVDTYHVGAFEGVCDLCGLRRRRPRRRRRRGAVHALLEEKLRHRRSREADGAGNDDGDVVGAAARVRQIDEHVGHAVHELVAHDGGDLVVGHDGREPVGA